MSAARLRATAFAGRGMQRWSRHYSRPWLTTHSNSTTAVDRDVAPRADRGAACDDRHRIRSDDRHRTTRAASVRDRIAPSRIGMAHAMPPVWGGPGCACGAPPRRARGGRTIRYINTRADLCHAAVTRETKSQSFFPADPIGVPCRRRRRPSMPPASGQSHGAHCAPWDCPRAAFRAVRCQPGGGTPSAASAMPQPSAGKLKQSCFSLLSPCAPWTPITLHNFETIHTRSLVIMPAHPIMFHVLTGMRSSRAHRMWSDFKNSSKGRGGALQDAADHRPRAACAARSFQRSAAARKSAVFTYSSMLPRRHLMVVEAFGRYSWRVSVSSCDRRLTWGAASAGAAGRTIGDSVWTRRCHYYTCVQKRLNSSHGGVSQVNRYCRVRRYRNG